MTMKLDDKELNWKLTTIYYWIAASTIRIVYCSVVCLLMGKCMH